MATNMEYGFPVVTGSFLEAVLIPYQLRCELKSRIKGSQRRLSGGRCVRRSDFREDAAELLRVDGVERRGDDSPPRGNYSLKGLLGSADK